MDKERLLELVINLLENKTPDGAGFDYVTYHNDRDIYRIYLIDHKKSIEVELITDYVNKTEILNPSEKDYYKIKWLIESYNEFYESKLMKNLEEFSKPENPVDELLSNPNE